MNVSKQAFKVITTKQITFKHQNAQSSVNKKQFKDIQTDQEQNKSPILI